MEARAIWNTGTTDVRSGATMPVSTTDNRFIPSYNQRQDGDISNRRRLLYGLAGGAIVMYGLGRRSLAGMIGVALGASVIYRSLTGAWPLRSREGVDADYSIRVDQAVTIDRPPAELYRFWRDFENLPRFMSHLESVTVRDGNRSHWVATAPFMGTVEWDAEVINEEENRMIAWRSVGDGDVQSAGSVRFEEAPGNRGTEVHVKLEYMPPGGAAGAMVARLFQEEPNQQVQDDLRRLKQMLEAGEIATTAGQPHGK